MGSEKTKGSLRHHGFQYQKGHPGIHAWMIGTRLTKAPEPRFRTAVMQEVIKDLQFCGNLSGLGRWGVVGWGISYLLQTLMTTWETKTGRDMQIQLRNS